MGWNETKAPLSEQLNAVLPEYSNVKDAPSMGDIEAQAGGNFAQFDHLMFLEGEKRYKAVNGSEDVYLIQNPALMSWQASKSATVIKRLPAERVGSLKELKSEKKKERHEDADQQLLLEGGRV